MRVNSPSALHRWSAPILLRLHGWPRWLFPIFTAALLLAGLLIPNPAVATVLLSVLALILGWLIALSWAILKPGPRVIRLAVLGVLLLAIVRRAQGRL